MRITVQLAAVGLLGGCVTEVPDPEDGAAPIVRVEASNFTFAAPATVPAGLTRVRLVNRGGDWHEAVITRLPEGVDHEAYLAGARAGEAFPAGAMDIGGPGLIAVGDSVDVVLPLEAGRYAIVCWHSNHVKVGMIVPLTVTATNSPADTTAVPPAPDGEVTLHDFRFERSGPFRAGRQVIHVRNVGQRPHDMTVYRLEPGRTLQDFGAWYRTRQGAPPATPAGGVTTMAPGHEAWVTMTLAPGRYFASCATPEGDKIHAQLGMIEEFEIP